jgi:DNA-binding CsgD family transcriptional regulator
MADGVGDSRRLERIVSAFESGLILVDSSGKVVWKDRVARQRLDGELAHLDLGATGPGCDAVDCLVSPVDVTVNGERLTIGVIREADAQKQDKDLMAAVEGVLSDSASWFTRTVIEKLKAIGQPGEASMAGPSAADLGVLSAREREVLGMICEGLSDVQMSQMLNLSENTVRNHIASLYRKIGVKRRTAAIIWARERGFVGRDRLGTERQKRSLGDGKRRVLPH